MGETEGKDSKGKDKKEGKDSKDTGKKKGKFYTGNGQKTTHLRLMHKNQ